MVIDNSKIQIMTRKTDPQIKEDIDRGPENDQGSVSTNNSRNNNYNTDEAKNESDKIKNANSTGLGTIGRNDQKQTGYSSNKSPDEGNE